MRRKNSPQRRGDAKKGFGFRGLGMGSEEWNADDAGLEREKWPYPVYLPIVGINILTRKKRKPIGSSFFINFTNFTNWINLFFSSPGYDEFFGVSKCCSYKHTYIYAVGEFR